jgi:hypothetical protein
MAVKYLTFVIVLHTCFIYFKGHSHDINWPNLTLKHTTIPSLKKVTKSMQLICICSFDFVLGIFSTQRI